MSAPCPRCGQRVGCGAVCVSVPSLSANEAFEIKAAAFHRMTGYLAPGKDCRIHDPKTRHDAWCAWIDQHREVIGALLWAVEDTMKPPPRQGSGWIACAERLPEDGVRVLAVNGAGYMTAVTQLYQAGGVWCGEDATPEETMGCVISCVTHWMPLPDSPHSPCTESKEAGRG